VRSSAFASVGSHVSSHVGSHVSSHVGSHVSSHVGSHVSSHVDSNALAPECRELVGVPVEKWKWLLL
jgi:hypothetical protein